MEMKGKRTPVKYCRIIGAGAFREQAEEKIRKLSYDAMTDGDGILDAKSSYVSGNLLLIGIYLEGPIDYFQNSWLLWYHPSCVDRLLRTTVYGA